MSGKGAIMAVPKFWRCLVRVEPQKQHPFCRFPSSQNILITCPPPPIASNKYKRHPPRLTVILSGLVLSLFYMEQLRIIKSTSKPPRHVSGGLLQSLSISVRMMRLHVLHQAPYRRTIVHGTGAVLPAIPHCTVPLRKRRNRLI